MSLSRLSVLRRLRDTPRVHRLGEPCQRCGMDLPAEHRHVADLESRRLLCVCPRCYDAMPGESTAGGSHRAVPQRYFLLPPTVITDDDWDAFDIPVGIAFFFHNSTLGSRVAAYPSAAGITESLLPATAWDRVLRTMPWTRTLVPDVEALLVRRMSGSSECFLVPIDTCYELAGRIRQRWTGFGGGPEVQAEIETFFAVLRGRSEVMTS